MAISLQKGGNVNLSKEAPSMKNILVGLGWNARATDGAGFDLDASAFLLQESGKVSSDAGFIFYNQKESVCKSVIHTGDNRTGAGDGDDESLVINLPKVPAHVEKIVFTVTIHDADARRQNFGQVGGAFIRIVNQQGGAELVRFDLAEDYATETAMEFAELYRHGGEWKFRAVGQGYAGGLKAMCARYGLNL